MAGPGTNTRRDLAKQGKAMSDPDGSGGRFPIRNRSDLQKAIRAVGRAKGDRTKVRRFIIKRARALSLASAIPDNWNSDGTVKGD